MFLLSLFMFKTFINILFLSTKNYSKSGDKNDKKYRGIIRQCCKKLSLAYVFDADIFSSDG